MLRHESALGIGTGYYSEMETTPPTRSSLRRVLPRVLLVALAALLAWYSIPTSGVTAQRIARLHPGMTREEVQKILGMADDTTMFSGSVDSVPTSSETWVYRAGDKKLTLRFSKQRLTTVENNGF